jgi:hypothetical protein
MSDSPDFNTIYDFLSSTHYVLRSPGTGGVRLFHVNMPVTTIKGIAVKLRVEYEIRVTKFPLLLKEGWPGQLSI